MVMDLREFPNYGQNLPLNELFVLTDPRGGYVEAYSTVWTSGSESPLQESRPQPTRLCRLSTWSCEAAPTT